MLHSYRLYKLVLFGFFLIAASFFAISSILAWQNPTVAPPGANLSAPVNVSATAQTKVGQLTLSGGATFPGSGIWNSSGNVGIGTSSPSTALEVVGGTIKATGGLIIETRTSDPGSPVTGQMWLRTDL